MKTTTRAVLGLMLIFALGLEVEADCQPNGCGPAALSKVPLPLKRFFRRACNKHDVCYACGKDNGWTRSQCDNGFMLDMSKLCIKLFFAYSQCAMIAADYYVAVLFGGGKYYHDPSLDWCSTCARSKGDPSQRVPLFGRR